MAAPSIPSSMKALRFSTHGPLESSIHLETVPTPKVDTNKTVLVHIRATAINPSDCKNVEGQFPQTTMPRTPGRDFAGTVVDGPEQLLGKNVWGTGGDYGYVRDGMHAEYVTIPTESVKEMPMNLSFAQAAASGVAFLTASLMIRRSGAKKGDYCLVIGSSGSVGSAAVLLLKHAGIHPIESSRHDAPAGVLDLTQPYGDQIKAITGGQAPVGILDTVSDPPTFQKALDILAPNGTYVIITVPRDKSPLSFGALSLYTAQRTVTGVNSNTVSFRDALSMFGELTSAFESGELKAPEPSRLQEVPMTDEAAVVQAYARTKAGAKQKQILVNS